MSEVDRFTRQGVGASDRAGFWVHAGDFNQKISQAKDREAYLQDQVEKWTALSGEHFKRAEILKLERDALQQLLNQRDEQVETLKLQPQGEPAGFRYRANGAPWEWMDESPFADGRTRHCENGEELEALYAEPPAPVAVVLPERMYSLLPGSDYWNACLDEVTRLNAKS